jgi:hypothetical protein
MDWRADLYRLALRPQLPHLSGWRIYPPGAHRSRTGSVCDGFTIEHLTCLLEPTPSHSYNEVDDITTLLAAKAVPMVALEK